MPTNGQTSLPRFRWLERTCASVPPLEPVGSEVHQALAALRFPPDQLQGRRIAITVGSRGIASLQEIVREACRWLKAQGARPFVFPAMGSHGGATAEGQRKVLEEYGITSDSAGVEVRSSMETVSLGSTPEGLQVFMDRNAWEADGVLVLNRVKPHTDFSGKIESGLLKMMAVGMGKLDGACEAHKWSRRIGFEKTIRAMASRVLATRKVLCAVGVVENEFHRICAVRAARPEEVVTVEERALEMAQPLVPRLPFSKFHLLIVDEIGKNISGTGMDTKVIGRGVKLQPGEAPEIGVIYARDLTPESGGNALGVGFADLIHEGLYRKIDFQKTLANVRTSLNLPTGRVPLTMPSDREALALALGSLGSPDLQEQRIAWIRNTLELDRLAVSACLAEEAAGLQGWRLVPEAWAAEFDPAGNLR